MDNKYVSKFGKDMEKHINEWKSREKEFYNTMVVPGFSIDPFLKPFMGTLETFPHNLYLLWVWGPHSKLKTQDITLDKLEALYQHGKITLRGTMSPVEKGKKFEDALADSLSRDFMEKLAKVFPEKLKHVGQDNKREDFLISEEYSIDAKYSDLETTEKFKNIIKPWGNDMYSAINKIEGGILRSMYKEGANQGQFRPTAQGQTRYRGILKYDKKNGWEEVTQADYDKYDFGPLPSLRKNIIYLYNDDGYWASYCLKQVVEWAKNHMKELGFTDNTRSYDYKSYNPYEFWGFGQTEWKNRQLWYGYNKNT